MVVIIKGTRDVFIAQDVEAARAFICKDAGMSMAELNRFKIAITSRDCERYCFDDTSYKIHLNPKNV